MELCWKLASGAECEFGEKCVSFSARRARGGSVRDRCRFTHDVGAYLAGKSRDIRFPAPGDLTSEPPFVRRVERGGADAAPASVDFATACPVFEESGHCRQGLKCRFLGGHARRAEGGAGIEIVRDEERAGEMRRATGEMNFLGTGVLKELRTKKASVVFRCCSERV